MITHHDHNQIKSGQDARHLTLDFEPIVETIVNVHFERLEVARAEGPWRTIKIIVCLVKLLEIHARLNLKSIDDIGEGLADLGVSSTCT